jgi:hypothetical protein
MAEGEYPPAPGGWGWPPGWPLLAGPETWLPDLPLLRLIPDATRRNEVIVEALRTVPVLHQLEPRHVYHKYGLRPDAGRRVLVRAQEAR